MLKADPFGAAPQWKAHWDISTKFFRIMNEGLATFVAGGASGMTVDFVLFPLDTIKTRLQTKAGKGKPISRKNFYAGMMTAA